MTLRPTRVTRVDMPEPDLIALTTSDDALGILLVSCTPNAVQIARASERPRGDDAIAFTTQLRQHLIHATITGWMTHTPTNKAAVLVMAYDGARLVLVASARNGTCGFELFAADGEAWTPMVRHGGHGGVKNVPAVVAHITTDWTLVPGLSTLERARNAAKRSLFERTANVWRRKLERQIANIDADIARADDVHALRHHAAQVLAHLHALQAKQREFVGVDFNGDTKTFALDPAMEHTQFADQLFHRARRVSRGLPVARERRARVTAQLEALDQALGNTDNHGALEQLLGVSARAPTREAHDRRAAKDASKPRSTARVHERLPYREFLSADNVRILVGRNAKDNDTLTTRVARTHDAWLHVRDGTGSHVIVALDKGATCPEQTLLDAATLAAHFSELKGQSIVEVMHTSRRFVHKRKGMPAGRVHVDQSKTIAVRLEPSRVQRLLETA